VAAVAEELSKPAEGLTLSRWSRLKREQRAGIASETLPTPAVAVPVAPGIAASSATAATPKAAEALVLPEISSISLTEDFTPFMQAKVPQLIKQQALKALFKSPHFNVMDGLDTYIDDYTVFEPISPEEMSKLSAWQSIQNPLQQVVTPGGYAVDVKSEEGMAVLAERERVAALEASGGATAEGDEMNAHAEISEPSAEPPTLASNNSPSAHPRYGRRVGDFDATDEKIDELLVVASPSSAALDVALAQPDRPFDKLRANGG
jgi:Protein of unknown function (DUF3306)